MSESKPSTDQKAARKAMLADAINQTETDVPLATPTATPIASSVAAPSTGVSPDVLAILQAFAGAIAQGQQSQQEGLSALLQQFQASMAEQAKLAREPIPENKVAPNVSAFNPMGERDHPRDGLKCHMYIGQYDEEGVVQAAYPIIEDACTREEQALCNALEQGEATVERNDGITGRVIVQARRDGAGKLNRIILAFPYGWLSKEFQAQLPRMRVVLEQILGKTAKEIEAKALAAA